VLKGFKEFILRGNVIELAVAVVIGAAFTASSTRSSRTSSTR
jgi:large-conductance mechanosensitive channel